MQDLLFYLFAGLTLLCALLVVANPFSRNPVTSVMFLVLTIASLAGIFILLDAYFLAAVQVLVYAGAVIVLFLFVIMLLNVKEEQRRRVRKFGLITGLISVAAISGMFARTFFKAQLHNPPPAAVVRGGTRALGELLFSQYLLPFEVVSILLLVAMIGTILLSKRNLE
jgi:NADH-quinone oxidoreductase subunit J